MKKILSSLPILAGLVTFACTIIAISYISLTQLHLIKHPEIDQISHSKMNFTQLQRYFKDLSEKKGALYAFDILRKAPLPYGTDSHWLAHTIGDELYKQEGVLGMKYCTDEFRNACSHSIAINLFYEKGETALSEITLACKQAPGGSNAYNLCYHGVGHGVFAYTNYDLPKTLELCKKASISKHSKTEFIECIGGAIMEQVSGGDHNKVTWARQRQINFKKNDPLYPCTSPLFDDIDARNKCLIFLTPYLWELAGRNTFIPTDLVLKNSFQYCSNLSDSRNRKACFAGFGKEFVPLAKNKDLREMNLVDEQIQQIYHWCSIAQSEEGQNACIVSAQGTIYWSGTTDKKIVERFCSIPTSEKIQDFCFRGLINSIRRINTNIDYRREFCNEIPTRLKEECKQQLKVTLTL